ncbi:hypothetical protein OAS39_07160 [Pirellulales bacterium]|nr:hypothetical protein [Pirellulales bacterium]
MLVGKVHYTRLLAQHGLVVILDTPIGQLPHELHLKIGDRIGFRVDGVTVGTANVAGIEHCDPYTPKRLFSFLISEQVTKVEVPIGAEVVTET